MSELTSIKAGFYALASHLRNHATRQAASVARLSSGERIQRAADDVASLSIASRMNTALSTQRSAITNLAQATSLLQVAGDALSQIDSALNRMQALAMQAGSGVLTKSERGFLDTEFQQLRDEVSRTIQTTSFNGIRLFPDQLPDIRLQSSEITFTPDLIDDIVLWVDAGDRSTIIDSAGRSALDPAFNGTVATILDKSIKQNNLTQANVTERPTYLSGVQNGNGVLSFDGINDRMLGNVSAQGKELSVFSVFNRTGGGNTREALFDYGSALEGSRNAWFLQGTTPEYYDYTTVNQFRNFSNPISYGSYTVISTIHNDTVVSGNLNGSTALDTTISTRDSSTSFVLGDDQTSGDELTGRIAEFFAFERALNHDEQVFMEGYLAHKWGIENELPTTHPFKNYAPGLRLETAPIDVFETPLIIGRFQADTGGDNVVYRVNGGSGRDILDMDPATGNLIVTDITKLGTETSTFTLDMEIRVGADFVFNHTVTVSLSPQGLFNFPIGSKGSTLTVNMGVYNERSLYGTNEMNLQTTEGAQQSFEAVQHAVKYITARRANVGARQASADIISASTQNAMQNLSAARSVYIDTDIASESSNYALISARTQASTMIAAQATSLNRDIASAIIEGEKV